KLSRKESVWRSPPAARRCRSAPGAQAARSHGAARRNPAVSTPAGYGCPGPPGQPPRIGPSPPPAPAVASSHRGTAPSRRRDKAAGSWLWLALKAQGIAELLERQPAFLLQSPIHAFAFLGRRQLGEQPFFHVRRQAGFFEPLFERLRRVEFRDSTGVMVV